MLARRRGALALLVLPLAVQHAAAVPAQATAPSYAASCAQQTVNRLDLRGRVGQLLLIGVPADSSGVAADVIGEHKVGGIFFAGRSDRPLTAIRASADAVQRAARTSTGMAAFVAVDQEGGLVQTLRGPGFTSIPTAVTQSVLSEAALRGRTVVWAAQLRSAGVNLNLAPVADTVTIAPLSANPPIGALRRHYGTTPAAAAADVATVVAALQDQRVSATLKHFPGLGRVRHNPDKSPLAVDRAATASDRNLQPFVAGADSGARAVMMSSAVYPQLDASQPAVLSSRIVTGLLQQQLGFRGVVMSDDIGAAAALRAVPLAQRATRFIQAGGHLILSVRSYDAGPLARSLIAKSLADPGFRRRVDAAAVRVVHTKVLAGLVACEG